ncbi:MAG: DEAD/DEAH box helicase family protein [Winogradskyella sp.]|uniref:DEAD/DEAH box helicase family protein n=1 Tax=Winogradskyella sp. TaxID=1883156 RepID=UPI00385C5DF4
MLESLSVLDFKFPWRSYQDQLLKRFDCHIADDHFHVIAPPGSGKTILGIEIMRRIGKKTLVLAPTLTIRNQWENRLQTFFTATENFKNYSFDIKAPSDVTFSTYQSLHALYKSFEDKEDYFKFFEKHNIEVVVLDEAHHLKNAWWQCLIALKNNNSFFVVALTATPPYDSTKSEITKYFTLCGEVDDEIAIPDLVKENDLAPHQDYVYFSKPNDLEINFIVDYRRKIADFKDGLLKDAVFIQFLKNHRFYKHPEQELETIYTNTSYFSSILVFLNACGISIEDTKLEILGFSKKEAITFPKLELEWLEILLQNLLVTDREILIASEDYLSTLEKKLRRLNVFERQRVNFTGEQLLYKSLAYSPSKLNSIVEIIKAEKQILGDNLNCVVLTDYIRKEFLNRSSENLEHITKIGVIPIFQYIRSRCHLNAELAVLTGSLVIVHKSILEAFSAIASLENFTFTPLETDPSFLQISVKGKSKKSIVSIMTALFENGTIKVLVGTKSLLGEGWDAPSINSLILASFVGSFVSSNQMRGRAIRKDEDQPNKTANIWHLACIDPTDTDGGREIDILKRRFEAFVGVTNTKIPFISNGFDRLNFPEEFPIEMLENLNNETLKAASKRPIITERWTTSIGSGTKLTKQVKLLQQGDQPYQKQKQIYYFDVVRFFIAELSTAILLFYFEFILEAINLALNRGFVYLIYAFMGAFIIRFGYKLYQAVTLYLRYGYLYKKIEKMGSAILYTMHHLKFLSTDFNSVEVVAERLNKGDVVCNLVGANTYEIAVFSKALTELLEPIDSPRYLIIKTSFFRKQLNVENFYAVPDIFGDKKENALVYQKYWKLYMGRNKLVFTRQVEGRKLLLKAKLFHVYNAFKKVSKEVIAWN